MNRRRFLLYTSSAIATLGLTVVSKSQISRFALAQDRNSLLIGAAASLREALLAIDPIFKQTHPNINVNYNFASSGQLQQQIEQGAPVDIFFSAALRQMDSLQSKNLLVNDTRRNLLTNRLVLFVPANSNTDLTSFRQLTNDNIRRIAVGDFRSVPAGQYAQEVFRNLGILDRLTGKFVFNSTVRQLLTAVERENVDAGVSFVTDTLLSNRVRAIATAPTNLHSPIVYPIAVLRGSKNVNLATRYLTFLNSTPAQNVFVRFGFGVS